MRVVDIQFIVQYLQEEGFCVDMVLLVEVGQYAVDPAYRHEKTY